MLDRGTAALPALHGARGCLLPWGACTKGTHALETAPPGSFSGIPASLGTLEPPAPAWVHTGSSSCSGGSFMLLASALCTHTCTDPHGHGPPLNSAISSQIKRSYRSPPFPLPPRLVLVSRTPFGAHLGLGSYLTSSM